MKWDNRDQPAEAASYLSVVELAGVVAVNERTIWRMASFELIEPISPSR